MQCFAGCGLRPCYLRFRMRYAVWALINCGLECGLRFKEHSTGCGFPRLFCPVCGFTENFMIAGCGLRDFFITVCGFSMQMTRTSLCTQRYSARERDIGVSRNKGGRGV